MVVVLATGGAGVNRGAGDTDGCAGETVRGEACVVTRTKNSGSNETACQILRIARGYCKVVSTLMSLHALPLWFTPRGCIPWLTPAPEP